MKIRECFVSNSSSTSFCIGFKEPITSVEQLQTAIGELSSDRVFDATVEQVLDVLFAAIKKAKPRKPYDAYLDVRPDVESTVIKYRTVKTPSRNDPDYYSYSDPLKFPVFSMYDRYMDKRVLDIEARKFAQTYKDYVFYCIEFEDYDGGPEAYLESGNAFYNIPHRSRNCH